MAVAEGPPSRQNPAYRPADKTLCCGARQTLPPVGLDAAVPGTSLLAAGCPGARRAAHGQRPHRQNSPVAEVAARHGKRVAQRRPQRSGARSSESLRASGRGAPPSGSNAAGRRGRGRPADPLAQRGRVLAAGGPQDAPEGPVGGGGTAGSTKSACRRRLQLAVMPPSITNSLPVTQDASSEAR